MKTLSTIFAVGETLPAGQAPTGRSAVAGVFTGNFSHYVKPNKSFLDSL